MKKIAIYPGTFDPITNGHLDIIKRSAKLFDELIIAVALSKDKNPMFSLKDRVEMASLAISDIPNHDIKVEGFDGLLVDFAKQKNSTTFIRGLRAVNDFEYELQTGYANKSLNKDIETLYFMPNLAHAFISSSVVRTILAFNTRCDHLVPLKVYKHILKIRGEACM